LTNILAPHFEPSKQKFLTSPLYKSSI